MKKEKKSKLINMILNNKVDRIFILYKDRLIVFSFYQLKQICKNFSIKIIVLSSELNEQSIEELT